MDYNICKECELFKKTYADMTGDKYLMCPCHARRMGFNELSSGMVRDFYFMMRKEHPVVKGILFNNLELDGGEECAYKMEHMIHDLSLRKWERTTAFAMTRHHVNKLLHGKYYPLKVVLLVAFMAVMPILFFLAYLCFEEYFGI